MWHDKNTQAIKEAGKILFFFETVFCTSIVTDIWKRILIDSEKIKPKVLLEPEQTEHSSASFKIY